jgi:hypothetical protein
MRALSTPAKLLAYVAAALGVVATLGLPWFAASPVAAKGRDGGVATLEEPSERFFGGLWRNLSADDGVSAYDRFAGADTAIIALAVVAVIAAALAAIPGAELVGRRLMQLAALALLGVVGVKLGQVAAADDLVEGRHGAVIALLCAAAMLMTASSVARQRLRRRPPAVMSSLHDPSLRKPGSVAPPGA